MSIGPHPDLVSEVRAALVARADPDRAAGQQRYMKSAMPYVGLTSPQLKAALAPLLRDPGLAMESREQWEATIRALWDGATHREQWYAAIALAPHLVRDTVLAHPTVEGLRMRDWAGSDSLWVRRAAIICQVGARDRLDQSLLADVIEPNIDDPDFFSRKAIGWALRDHARADPQWVRAFVVAHPDLSGLSRREALKHLGSPA